VVCITHSLANVEATCHLVVILTEGGRLAFFGTPEEARDEWHCRPALAASSARSGGAHARGGFDFDGRGV
jgi:ABC-type multidrug transport system ATPase subunit